mmetsp:Transcript_50955/g.81333  ORF Transcript_50955/g.81333 Transcript_50955/m.81333 type:complete len:97 (-) Transcript_50955:64-354(-)
MHSVEFGGDGSTDDAGDCAESGQHAKNANSQNHRRHATIRSHGGCWCHENCWHSSASCNLKGSSSKLCLWAGGTEEGDAAECYECDQCDAQRDQLG